MPAVHKLVKHTLKLLHEMQQFFQRVFNRFVDTKYYRADDEHYLRN